MGYAGDTYRIPLIDTGLRDDRNQELLPATALIIPSKNMNYHENGLSKRGGSEITIAGNGHSGQGMFQFQTPTQRTLMLANNGNVYQTNYSNSLTSGLSTQNFVSFVQTANKAFFADGQTAPQYWDGVSPTSTPVTTPTSWTGNMPFQMVNHTRAGSGSGDRLWAVTPDSLWASGLGTPTDFGDVNVIQIPIDSIGGLVGAYDLGGQLFAFSRTQTFLIIDDNPDTSLWGYTNALWEGGVASWRLIAKADNNLFLMAEDGLQYSLQGIIATGSYASAAINRPAFVDKFIRDNVNLQNIQNFHVEYDRKLRALKWFMQEGGSINNIALTYFIDKQPQSAWIVHDNELFSSGYNATCGCEVRVTPGNYQIWTMDGTGDVWTLEQTSRDDNANPYPVHIKVKPEDLDMPVNLKHLMALKIRGQASGQVNFLFHVWIEGARQQDATLTINGTGAMFDSAHFDVDTFSGDTITSAPVQLGYYGRDIQFELIESEVGTDFFLSEIIILAKKLGIKIAA